MIHDNDNEHEHEHDNVALFAAGRRIPLVLVVLNTEKPLGLFERLWNNASLKICADGAANRLYDSFEKVEVKQRFIPDLIHGDMDSIRPDVERFYEQQGSKITRDDDQDRHDLDKCLGLAFDAYVPSKNGKRCEADVFVLGAFGGRLDHEMANINMLFRWKNMFSRLVLMSSTSMAFLLDAGSHKIIPDFSIESRVCALIPVGVVCKVTTKGLKWDVKEREMRFGGLVSSSNEVADGVSQVLVYTDNPILYVSNFAKSSM